MPCAMDDEKGSSVKGVLTLLKLETRMKLSYICVFFLPILLIIGIVMGVVKIGLSSLGKQYDMDQAGYSILMNPTTMVSHMASTTIATLHQTAEENPDLLKNAAYLETVNESLFNNYSYLVVKRDNVLIYEGLPEDKEIQGMFSMYMENKAEGDVYVMSEQPYRVYMMDFKFSDDSDGRVFIYTDLTQLMPAIYRYLVGLLISAVLVLFVASAASMYYLYKSIVRPIRKLKQATENIAEGNLSFSLTAESDDEIGELTEAFEEMRLKLKTQIEQNIQTEKDSKELISNISHDLKTPMTSIKGYIEGLMDGVADTEEKRDRYIRTIYNKVNDMNSLIEELFLYAKLDSNAVTYNFVKMNLDAYFQDCVDEISLDLEAQDVKFGYFNYADRSTQIVADPEQLKRVINNIIGNSVKYQSPNRPLAIGLRIIEEAEFVKIEIEDNGKGISKKEVPLIFDRLYRTDASRNSSKGGSGLGLSIAKKIIEEHGGKIWAVSTEGVGTTMCFVLRKYN